jgi:hypothetical protein
MAEQREGAWASEYSTLSSHHALTTPSGHPRFDAEPEFEAGAYQHAELSHIASTLRDLGTNLKPILDAWQELRAEKFKLDTVMAIKLFHSRISRMVEC